MFQRYPGRSTGSSGRRQMNTNIGPQWEVVHGKVISLRHPHDIFRGDEILEVQVIDASYMDVASITMGQQKIRLQSGQQFPIRFQFYYDKSRARPGNNQFQMQASIRNSYGQLLYVNDTQTPLKNNVKIDVIRV